MNIDQRHALIANVNLENNLLTYSYWKNNDYAIKIEDLATNKTFFFTKIKDKSFTEPRINDHKLYFPESNDTFICLDYKTKKVIWKLPTKGRIREFQIVKDTVIIASIAVYGLVAINANTGKVMYELLIHSDKGCLVDDAPRPIGFDENNFFVTNFNGASISAYEISSGKMVWSKKENPTSFSNFIVSGKYIFIGSNDSYKTGEIMLIETKTGKVVYSQDSKFEIMMDPVSIKNKVYYYTYDSKLNEFDIEKKTSKILYKFSPKNDISGSQIYLLDNALYFQDMNFDLNKLNLNTLKKEIIGKGEKGLLGVYKINNKVKFIY